MGYFNTVKQHRFILAILLFFQVCGKTQSIAGYWYGSASIMGTQGNQHNYLIELILTDRAGQAQGVLNYYFKNLYRSIPINGIFDRSTQQFTLKHVPFIYFGSVDQLDVDCFMDAQLNLVMARAGSTLSGQWLPEETYKYTCPTIQVRLSLDKDQSINDSLIQAVKSFKEQFQVWTPPPPESNDPILTITPRSVKNYVAERQQTSRSIEVAEEMEVDMDDVKISLYDNGEVDGDSISVFLNGKLIATHQRLSTRPIQLTIPLDSLLDYVELSMFAENLGSIPPNTALMIVEAGDRQYQIRLTSTLEKSASVRIKRKRNGLKVR